MIELPGVAYLYNLSLLAATVAVVSALVMVVRQTMGGKLSNFDVYLLTTYISLGFVIAISAIVPPLVALFDPPPWALWLVASGLSALMLGTVMASVISSRHRASSQPISRALRVVFAIHWFDVALLAANAVAPQLRSVSFFAIALTLSLLMLMWAFVRRIASLLGDKPGEDWDPKRG